MDGKCRQARMPGSDATLDEAAVRIGIVAQVGATILGKDEYLPVERDGGG
jgi:hypothetical protein